MTERQGIVNKKEKSLSSERLCSNGGGEWKKKKITKKYKYLDVRTMEKNKSIIIRKELIGVLEQGDHVVMDEKWLNY